MKQRINETEAWEAVGHLYHAAQYLQDDTGERNIFWTPELNEACNILAKHAVQLTARITKQRRERGERY